MNYGIKTKWLIGTEEFAKFVEAIESHKELMTGDEFSDVSVDSEIRPSFQKYLKSLTDDQFQSLQALVSGRLSYSTKALMDADTGQAANTLAEVWNDSTDTNNGLYGYDGAAWVKSAYDWVTEIEEIKSQIDGGTSSGGDSTLLEYKAALAAANEEKPKCAIVILLGQSLNVRRLGEGTAKTKANAKMVNGGAGTNDFFILVSKSRVISHTIQTLRH